MKINLQIEENGIITTRVCHGLFNAFSQSQHEKSGNNEVMQAAQIEEEEEEKARARKIRKYR